MAYNTSRIVLAQIDAGIAWHQFYGNLQHHLVQVAQAYWQLYLERVRLLQQQRLHRQASVILADLEGRRTIDALRSQVVRARAAVATRRADFGGAARSIRNAEAQIRALVNAPELTSNRDMEMIPLDAPAAQQFVIDLQEAAATALRCRPEINEVIAQVRGASTRLHVSQNELLPLLNLVLESYVAGIADRGDIAQAFADQFGEGEPSYTAGLQMEVPLGRRQALAVYQRRRIELRQLTSQFETATVNILAEVEIAAGEVETTYQEMLARYEAMQAAEEEVEHLDQRWRSVPGEERVASYILEELLEAQQRSAIEQFGFVRSQVAHTMALIELRRATGTLLQHEQIVHQRVCDGCIPRLIVDKQSQARNVSP